MSERLAALLADYIRRNPEFADSLRRAAELLIPAAERIDKAVTEKGQELADEAEQWLKERS